MRRVLMSVVLGLGLTLWPLAVGAATKDEIVSAFQDWMATYKVATGAIVVFRDGKKVAQFGTGIDPAGSVELASLSKAITAACVARLVKKGQVAYSDTLAQRLGWADAPGQITLAELLSQNSGLKEDYTQNLMSGWLFDRDPHWPAVGDLVHKSGRVGEKSYRYNNVNYALLGLVIEAVTGTDYVSACAPVTSDFGSARLSRQTGGFAPWGGWRMSLEDYGLFVLRQVRPGLSRAPAANIGGGARYGMGMVWRKNGIGVNMWHHGLHCFPGRLETGSFFAAWNGPWAVAVSYVGCLSDPARDALDTALAGAALR